MKEIYKVLVEQKKFLEQKGYNVVYVGLYGSQNYGLSDTNSDIDVRAVVLPSLEQIITRDKISKKYVTEHGDIDVKDIVTYYEVVRKGNFSFIEPFQSDWYIGDKYLRELFGAIPLNLKSVKGAMLEKAKAFRHPYPSKKAEIDSWGYDPKQLHHIIRLIEVLEMDDKTKSFKYYFERSPKHEFLMNIKRNKNNIIDNLQYIDITNFETMKKWINEEIESNNLIPLDYKYDVIELSEEVTRYITNHLKLKLNNTSVKSARQYRTFGTPIPKKDLKKFPELEEYDGQDISYIVYENVEIL